MWCGPYNDNRHGNRNGRGRNHNRRGRGNGNRNGNRNRRNQRNHDNNRPRFNINRDKEPARVNIVLEVRVVQNESPTRGVETARTVQKIQGFCPNCPCASCERFRNDRHNCETRPPLPNACQHGYPSPTYTPTSPAYPTQESDSDSDTDGSVLYVKTRKEQEEPINC